MPKRIVLGAFTLLLASTVTAGNSALAAPRAPEPRASLIAALPLTVTPALGTVVPAGTHVRFHLDAPLSSTDSTTGQRFTFTLIDPIVAGAADVARAGAHGNGTVLLAGHAGTNGHEGDLTLRIDSIDTPNHNALGFNDGRFEINGTNHKIASGVLGFVPFAGVGARYIRGREIRVETDVPVLFVTTHPATVMSKEDAEFLTFPVPVVPSHPRIVAPSPAAADASPSP